MKLMVACKTLTWVEVDTETGDVGPARLFASPENLDVEGRYVPDRQPTVLAVDANEDENIRDDHRAIAIQLVTEAETFDFVTEGDR